MWVRLATDTEVGMDARDSTDGTQVRWVAVAPDTWRARGDLEAAAVLAHLVPVQRAAPAPGGGVGGAGAACALAGAAVLLLGYLLMIVVLAGGPVG